MPVDPKALLPGYGSCVPRPGKEDKKANCEGIDLHTERSCTNAPISKENCEWKVVKQTATQPTGPATALCKISPEVKDSTVDAGTEGKFATVIMASSMKPVTSL